MLTIRPWRGGCVGTGSMDVPEPASVLVVDDRAEMAEMIADDLGARGYQATAVFSGREALALLARGGFDAVVTDLRMPEVDGLDLLRASRELDPARPVIVMTAFEAMGAALAASEHGVCHYLVKPFRLDVLADLLGRAIARRRGAASG